MGINEVYINPDDFEWNEETLEPFWKHIFIITLPPFGPRCIINADNLQDAIDYLIDYCEENWPGFILSEEDQLEAEREGYIDDFIYGGNHGKYLNEPIFCELVKQTK